jgi:hypothetical protein
MLADPTVGSSLYMRSLKETYDVVHDRRLVLKALACDDECYCWLTLAKEMADEVGKLLERARAVNDLLKRGWGVGAGQRAWMCGEGSHPAEREVKKGIDNDGWELDDMFAGCLRWRAGIACR